MKYTQIPVDTFKNIQLNAGILLNTFDPESGEVSRGDILGATSGGAKFDLVPNFKDYGEDIDNCPKNTMELKKIDDYSITMGGTMLTMDTATAKSLVAAADVSGNKITPRHELSENDFDDLWWVGDRGEGGGLAIHMKNALSTGGFSLQTGDRAKGQFAFTYTAHYSLKDPNEVPCDLYVLEGD